MDKFEHMSDVELAALYRSELEEYEMRFHVLWQCADFDSLNELTKKNFDLTYKIEKEIVKRFCNQNQIGE